MIIDDADGTTAVADEFPVTGIVAGRPVATAEQQMQPQPVAAASEPAAEIGGPKGPEPTRYGDWEKNGRCIDF